MATLTGQTIAATYDALLKVTDNGPITSSLKLITDGLGNNTALSLSNAGGLITGTFSVSSTISASNLSGTNTGDETNATIKTKLGAATTSVDGYLTSTDWNTFNNKVPASRTLTINGTAYDLSADRSWTIVAGVSSFNTRTGAITLTSLDVTDALGFTPVTNARTISTTAPLSGGGDLTANRTLSISQATTSTDGYLSSTDWNTFNGKVAGSGTTNYISKFTSSSAIGNSLIYNDANSVLINDTFNIATNYKLQVTGDIYTSGSIAIGSVSSISTKLFGIGRAITGATTAYGITFEGNIESTVTTNGIVYRSYPIVTGGTLSAITHYIASKNAFIGGSTVTNQYGFFADASVSGATNNYGFYGNIASATGAWNLYMNGTAQNYINGNLGIGVAVPTVKLDVSGAGLFSSSVTASSFIKSGGTSAQLLAGDGSVVTAGTNITISGGTISSSAGLSGSGTTNYVPKFTGSSAIGNSLIFDNGTNVGIGTTSPAQKLDVNGSSIFRGWSSMTIGSPFAWNSINSLYIANGYASGINTETADGSMAFYNAPSGTAGASVTFSERMRITSGGNVGIGTSSPAYKLDVSGAGRFINTGGVPALDIRASDANFSLMGLLGNQTGDVNWLLMSGYPNAGDFTIRQSDVVNAITIKKTSGNVGIGTSSPGSTLEVNGTGRFNGILTVASGSAANATIISNSGDFVSNWIGNSTVQLFSIRNNSTTGVFLNTQNSAPLRFGVSTGTTGGTIVNHFEIASSGTASFSGNVGIGTTSPSANLEVVRSSTGTVASFGINGQTINPRLRIDADESNNTVTLNPNYSGSTSPALVFKTQEVERMRILASGNVGIGTSSPSEALSVNGNIILTGTANRYIRIQSASNYYYNLQSVGDDFHIVEAGSTPRFVIKYPSGNVGIGTSSPTRLLSVNSQAYIAADIFQGSNSGIFFSGDGGYASGIYGRNSGNDLVLQSGSNERMRITSSGNVLIGTTSDNSTGAKLQVNGGITYVNIFNRRTASYTLALTDQNDIIEMNVGSANNLTVPLNSSVAFPIGTEIAVLQYGSGQTTIVATGGVTLRSKSNALKISGQFAGCTLVKVGTDEWYVVGDLTI